MRTFRTTDAHTQSATTEAASYGERPLMETANTALGTVLHEDHHHPDVGRPVRDIASGVQGTLIAVVRDKVSTPPHGHRFVRLAYVKGDNDVEWSTDPHNIVVIP